MSDVVSGRFTNVAIINTVEELKPITTLSALDVRPRISLAAASTNVSEWYSFWGEGGRYRYGLAVQQRRQQDDY